MNAKKIPVAILGATGMVGQKFIEMLADHPWFEIVALAASEKSQGKCYQEAVRWVLDKPIPSQIASMQVSPCEPTFPCRIAFSGLDSSVAGEIEQDFASSGYIVVSNSSNHRMDPNVPLLIPEVNPDHLELVKLQPYGKGMIVTNPNCSVIGLVTVLKPLMDQWGVEVAHVTTMQAISGAGYPGVPSYDILDNILPYIAGEEEKVETEPLKILGALHAPSNMRLSAHCNRVAVMNGHTACVSLKLGRQIKAAEILNAWKDFSGVPQQLSLPTAPGKVITYFEHPSHPQPKLHRDLERGMGVAVGRLRKCPILDWKFVLLSHNTVRGAAGCAILNAELLVKKGYL